MPTKLSYTTAKARGDLQEVGDMVVPTLFNKKGEASDIFIVGKENIGSIIRGTRAQVHVLSCANKEIPGFSREGFVYSKSFKNSRMHTTLAHTLEGRNGTSKGRLSYELIEREMYVPEFSVDRECVGLFLETLIDQALHVGTEEILLMLPTNHDYHKILREFYFDHWGTLYKPSAQIPKRTSQKKKQSYLSLAA